MTYYNDGEVLQTKFSGSLCASDDDHHMAVINLDRYSDDRSSGGGRAPPRDGVHALDDHRVGGTSWTPGPTGRSSPRTAWTSASAGFAFGEPTASGWTSWFIDEDAKVKPWVSGAIHLNNSSGVCARMKFAIGPRADLLGSRGTPTAHCAPDNGHH